MPSKVPTSTMSNAAAPAHAHASPAAATNRARQAGTPVPARRPAAEPGVAGRGSPALADPGRRRPGPADGGARRHDREHRAALSPARLALLRHRAAVGGDRLRPRLRQPAAARRPAHRPDRPQGDVHRRPDRLRGRVRGRRRGGQLRHARRGPCLPGRLRRAAGPGRAVAADHHVRGHEGPGQGVRCLRRHRGRRRSGRPAARRAADPVPGLALVPVRQPHLRRDRVRRSRHAAAPAVGQPAAAAGPARARGRGRRHVLHRLRLLQRGQRRLARASDVGLPCRRRGVARGVRLHRDAGPPAAAAAADRPGPQPGRRLPVDPHHRRRHVRHLPVPDLLPAGDPGLQPGHGRCRLPAHGRRRSSSAPTWPTSCCCPASAPGGSWRRACSPPPPGWPG